jgi:hypothetical protein
MEKSSIYPVVDEKREKRISICQERLIYGASVSFFSQHFKRSEEVIDGVLRGYTASGTLKEFFSKREFCVRADFEKKKALPKIKEILYKIKEEDSTKEIDLQDILVYFSGGRYKKVLLTCDRFISDYKRDDDGTFLNCKIKDIDIINSSIVRDNRVGQEYNFGNFPEIFVKLFLELKMLNQSIEVTSNKHPLNKEMREMRENYLNILIDYTLMNGVLTSRQVLRIEILARQLGIDSISVLKMISNSMAMYHKYNKDISEYLEESIVRLEKISSKYFYMLYHDIIAFELLSQKEDSIEIHSNEFLETIVRQCSIKEEFRKSYTDSVQRFLTGSYLLRKSLEQQDTFVKDREAYENLYHSIEYEYGLQKELLR